MFSLASRVVAILAVAGGVAQYALGLAIATGFIGPYEAALSRYTSASSSGELINHATYAIVFGLALGTLAEIGIAVRKAGGARRQQ
jgi:hypothetical protein